MLRTSLALTAVAFGLPFVASTAALAIDVPGDAETIQGGILLAGPEDPFVNVGPGEYAETIDFLGKAITVRSTGAPFDTIIHAQGLGATAGQRYLMLGNDK